jgi:glycosyltransferase involved in cell wall biosynthesis
VTGIIALIPAYQEGPRIALVVEGTRDHLPVVVIDDGSTDETAARAKAAGATVLAQVPNAGKGAALRAGFRHALEAGAEAVVTLDADGQHDPAEIPRFLEAFEAGRPELVIGRRDFGSMPPVRRLSNTLGGLVFSAAVGRRVADNQSGYRLIGRQLMTHLLDSRESGFEFEVEMIARCIALGLPMAEVPIRTIYAGEPSHIRPWTHFKSFLRVSRDARRIVRGG